MENDRESRQSLCYFFKYVETQWRRYEDAFFVSCALCRCELVCAVGSSDCNCQRIAACSAYEFFNFFRSCITLVSGFYDYLRLIFFSDGVAQSGIALGPSNKEREDDPAYAVFRSQRRIVQSLPSVVKATGWGTDNVSDFIQKKLVNNPDISSRQLARAIVTEANKNDKYTPNDDITCCVIGVKKPRRTLIVTGAPRSRESDKKLGERIKNFDGQIIVCGGTTAKIVARELGKDVKADKAPAGNLPPASKIEGIDLVTEGMLTLSEVAKRLTEGTLLKQMSEDAAKRMIAILRETDQVEIIVGTKINDEVDDPSMAAKIGLRFPTVDEIRRALIKNYFKECEVQYL